MLTRARIVLGSAFLTALAMACSSSDDASNTSPSADGGLVGDGGGSGSDGSSTDGGGLLDGDADNPFVDGPDEPPVPFPTTLPALFGYTLVDAFPGTFLSGAMDIEWPAGAGSTIPFVLERGGAIVRPHDGVSDVVLDFSATVAARAEAGALGMALHPKFADAITPKPYAYVWYTAEGVPTHQRLSRWTWNAATNKFDPASELVLVSQAEGATQHNGAHIRFGPDGFLYFGNGDDTRPEITTQTLSGGLFSGIFRIDVDSVGGAISHAPPKQPLDAVTQGYFIPNTNPFVGTANAAEEYFALGFRNPYSFNFDKTTGKLWLGDVGDTWREEIDNVVAGGNYGWPYFEGTLKKTDIFATGAPTIGALKTPLYDYTHASIGDLCATSAGYVYRGAALPELAGKLIYSDWPVGRVWSVDTTTGVRSSLVESNIDNAPVGWGQDAAGEVYLVAWSKILRLARAAAPHGVPAKLSQTKIFRNRSTLKVPTAITPYSIKSPLWSDGAAKQRWVYVPSGKTSAMTANGAVTLPSGSMLIKQFDLPDTAKPANGRTHRLETRVIVIGADAASTYGVTYRWNAQGTDADLVFDPVEETITDTTTPAENRTWHFPSTGECWSCHRVENRVLAFRGEQMNFNLPDGTNQLAAFVKAGIMDAATVASSPQPIASPSDTTATIDARAGAYLAANCSPCHHPGASYLGDGETWNALPNVAASARGLINQPHHNYPMAAALNLINAPLVAPGNPAGSLLRQRLNATDQDIRMPPLLRTQADPVGVSVIDAWISSLAAP